MTDIENYLGVLSLCGVSFILAGLAMLFFPPKKINSLYGYRTTNSMKNQKNWDFAQKYSTKFMLLLSIVFLLIATINIILSVPEPVRMIIEFIVLLSGIGCMFWKVEKEIKKQQS
ncbi:SdpI family protein [Paenimyroides ceti]